MRPSPFQNNPLADYLNDALNFTLISEAEQGLMLDGRPNGIDINYDSVDEVGKSLRLVVDIECPPGYDSEHDIRTQFVFFLDDEGEANVIASISNALATHGMPKDILSISNILARLNHESI